jgi:exodeoxyribonuclease VII large subunit
VAVSRERAGLLLDRAARAVGERLDGDARRLVALADRAPRIVLGRTDLARSRLAAATASLAALAPQATLDRGYAIVRRGPDGTIVRDPGAAPTGTPLELTLARGTLAATSQGPGASKARTP